jgi:hypothetical protein
MTADDDQRKREQRQRMHDEIRRIAAEMTMAHTMTDEESAEALLAIAVEDAFAGIEDLG